jgi:serine/threonine-protein kinase
MNYDDRVLDLVEQAQDLQEQGLPVRTEELCRDQPELRGQFEKAWRAMNRIAPVLSTPRLPGSQTLPRQARPATSFPTVPGYQVVGVLGEGGMGVVYRAWQSAAGRYVALKMIRDGELATPRERHRFQTEAEKLAELDHPHIVPVYGVGEHQGQPFFSMKLIEGGSLENRADHRTEDWQEVARLMEKVAWAVHHAHQRGILHRDLKPANILLDELGEPYVADLGLAKRFQDLEGLTQSGYLVGTPRYMAPEQTEGRKSLSTAADTYALGAILYALLAGKPPFPKAEGVSMLEILFQVRIDEPVRPRYLRREIPADLETICLKCLRKEPDQRYATAADLAHDLRRFQAGEPIRARRVRMPERVVKWARRRPLLAGLLAALVLMTTLAVTGVAWAGYQRQEVHQEKAKRLAELNRFTRLAVGAVEMVRNNEALRAREPHMEASRRQVLEMVAELGRDLPQGSSADPEVRSLTGRVSYLLGEILQLLGESEPAKEAYERAIQEWKQLSDEHPEQAGERLELVLGYNQLGGLLLDRKEIEPAQSAFESAERRSRELVREFPNERGVQDALAYTLFHQGSLLFEKGSRYHITPENQNPTQRAANPFFSRAESALSEALELQQGLVDHRQPDPEPLFRLAKTRHTLAQLWAQWESRNAKAEKSYREALDIYQRLVDRFPRVPEYRQKRARCRSDLGTWLGQGLGQFDQAAALYDEAVRDQRRLVEDFPRVPVYRKELADSHLFWGELLEANPGQRVQADEHYREARQLYHRLAAEHSTEPYLGSLARASYRLACSRRTDGLPLLLGRDHLSDAERLLDEAIRNQALAQKAGSQQPLHRWAAFDYSRELAEVLVSKRDHARAAEIARELPRIIPAVNTTWIRAAEILAGCVRIAQQDDRLTRTQQDQMVEAYGRAAVEMLEQAVPRGATPEFLKTDSGLDPIRMRADFRKLVNQGAEKP